MCTIRAKFIGRDSLGYKNGDIYELKIKENSITLMDGSQLCLYSNIQTFLKNWDVLQHFKPSELYVKKDRIIPFSHEFKMQVARACGDRFKVHDLNGYWTFGEGQRRFYTTVIRVQFLKSKEIQPPEEKTINRHSLEQLQDEILGMFNNIY